MHENATRFNGDYVLYHSVRYYLENESYFKNNSYIEQGIKDGTFRHFAAVPQIPKIIHYCWFGKNPKTDTVLRCIAS